MAFSENYLQPAKRKKEGSPSHGGFPSVLIETSLAIGKQSTSLTLCKHNKMLDWSPNLIEAIHSKSTCPVDYKKKASLIRYRRSQPSHQDIETTKAYSIYVFNLCTSNIWSLEGTYKAGILIDSNSSDSSSLLVVGNLLCLVLLCLISARRDKVCPQYRARNWDNTNPLQSTQKTIWTSRE